MTKGFVLLNEQELSEVQGGDVGIILAVVGITLALAMYADSVVSSGLSDRSS